jgi:hypothetical protein
MHYFEMKDCAHCRKPLMGRTDKKYCDDTCRNAWNNIHRKQQPIWVRSIDQTLHRNRKLLEEVVPQEGKIRVMEKKLIDRGFNFQYFTHQVNTRKGTTYYFVYEFGFLPLDNGYIMVVRREDDGFMRQSSGLDEKTEEFAVAV